MQAWPKGAWFGLTKKRLILPFGAFSTVLFLLLADYGHARYKAYKVRQIITALQSLTPGKSTGTEARELASRYKGYLTPDKGCTIENCSYGVTTYSCAGYALISSSEWLNNRVWRLCDSETLNFLGFRQWRAVAWATVRSNTVRMVGSDITVEGPDHLWFDASWNFLPEKFDNPSKGQEEHLSQEMQERQGSFGSWHHLHVGGETGEGLEWVITPASQPEKIKTAFNINLDCLTKPVGCARMRELAPNCWKYIDRPGDDYW